MGANLPINSISLKEKLQPPLRSLRRRVRLTGKHQIQVQQIKADLQGFQEATVTNTEV
jgi:hypothetical protein